MLADAARPEWLQWILDPLRGDPALASAMLAACAPLAVVFTVALFLWIRRHGPSGGALSFEGFIIGLPLAAAVMILPQFIVPLGGENIGHALASRSLEYGLTQVALTLAAIMILYRNPIERAETPRPQWLAVQPRTLSRTMIAWVVAIFALQTAIIASIAIARLWGGQAEVQPVLGFLIEQRNARSIIGAYVLVVAGAALSEEFIFRLVLYGGLRRLFTSVVGENGAHWIALGLSVAAFVAVHGLLAPALWYLIAPMTILSVALTLTYAHTRSIWPSVLMHAVHNAFTLTLALTLT
ncbi:MAG: CPBP family intramembrane metalloprotease [Planctomycetes bacterium]|nr:CPBP family intramembrane metalloprotease [Planctomycetota bacterium]